LKIKIKKYVAEGQSSVVDQIKGWYTLMVGAGRGSPGPLIAKLTGNDSVGEYLTPDGLVPDFEQKPNADVMFKLLQPYLSGNHLSGSQPQSAKLNFQAANKAAFGHVNKLAHQAVERSIINFGSLTAREIISTCDPEFINRALKYTQDQVKDELSAHVANPGELESSDYEWFDELLETVRKALKEVESVRSRKKTDESNALATLINSQYSGKDFTKILQDYVSKNPDQSPCDGFTEVDGRKEPVTILGMAVKSYVNGSTRPLEFLAKNFPKETLDDDGNGQFEPPILSAPTEKQDEVQEAFHKYKNDTTSGVSRDPELDKVSDDEVSSDRFGGDVNAFLKDLVTPYMMVSFDGKIINNSNDLIKEIQLPLGKEVKQKGTLKLSTVQQFAKHAIDNGLVEMDVDEDALEISKMKRGMKEVCKKIIDTLGNQSRSNSNGLTKSEQRFLRIVAKKCALLPNGGIASLEKLRELRDLGKKKGMLHKWLSNPRNKQFKQGALRGVLGRIAHPIDTVVNAAKDVGEKLGFGESQDFNELQFRTYQRVVESRVKDPFGQRELLKTTSEDYLFLDEEEN